MSATPPSHPASAASPPATPHTSTGEQLGSRAAILARVREALGTPSADVVRHGHDAHAPTPSPTPAQAQAAPLSGDAPGFRAWLPQAGADVEERIALFAALSAGLKTRLILANNPADAMLQLQALAHEEHWERVGSHHTPLTDALVETLGLPVCWTDGGYDKDALNRCQAGITTCDALIAQTGGVLVTTRDQGGRALSVLPEHHVVIATIDQLLPDLPAAFERLAPRMQPDAAGGPPSFTTFITGPSRTGDIERILVLGAHGPKRLSVILITSPAEAA